MTRYRLSPVALDDIDEIAQYIHAENPDAARRFVEAIYDSFDLLARHPHAGHRRRDLTDLDVFFWTAMKRFAVIYRKSTPIEIIHVRRWAQDLASLLDHEAADR